MYAETRIFSGYQWLMHMTDPGFDSLSEWIVDTYNASIYHFMWPESSNPNPVFWARLHCGSDCVILGVKKSLVYKRLQYFHACGTAHNLHAHKTGRSWTLSPLDIKFIATLVAQHHCIYLDEICQALSEQRGCVVSMADAATANIPTPISSSPPSTLVTQWQEGVHMSDAVCHILRTGQSLPSTARSSRWMCIRHHIHPPDLLIPASYWDGRVRGCCTHRYLAQNRWSPPPLRDNNGVWFASSFTCVGLTSIMKGILYTPTISWHSGQAFSVITLLRRFSRRQYFLLGPSSYMCDCPIATAHTDADYGMWAWHLTQ